MSPLGGTVFSVESDLPLPSHGDHRPSLEPADWRTVATRALEMVEQPAALIARGGTVQIANRAFSLLMGSSPGSVEHLDCSEVIEGGVSALEVTTRHRDARVALLSGSAFAIPLRLHVSLKLLGSETSGAVLVTVESAERQNDDSGRRAQRGHYLVSARTVDRGALLEVDDSACELPMHMGGACYRTIAGRAQPCRGCPVFDDLDSLPARTVLPPEEHGGVYRLVEVRRKSTDLLEVHAFTVGSPIIGDLLRAKVGWIARESGLSGREAEVLDLLYMGRTNRDVASLLDISERTVKYHQANILRKVGADSRVDLVRLLL